MDRVEITVVLNMLLCCASSDRYWCKHTSSSGNKIIILFIIIITNISPAQIVRCSNVGCPLAIGFTRPRGCSTS